MEQLRSWLKTVTGLVIILGVLETLLPDAVGRIAKLVFGLALMAAILQPVLFSFTDWAVVARQRRSGCWLATAERLQARALPRQWVLLPGFKASP